MHQALLIAFYLLFPVFILFLTWRFRPAEKIGAVLIAYLAGLINFRKLGCIEEALKMVNFERKI